MTSEGLHLGLDTSDTFVCDCSREKWRRMVKTLELALEYETLVANLDQIFPKVAEI